MTLIENQNLSSLKKPAISYGKPLQFAQDAPKTLGEVLQRTAQNSTKEIIYIQPDGSDKVQSYQELWQEAQRILGGLRKLGLKPQDKVIFQLESSQDFICAFWGCVLGGFVPVPISIAPTYEQINSSTSKLQNTWQVLGKPLILTSATLAPQIDALSKLLKLNFQIKTIDKLRESEADFNLHQSQPEDLAILLLTSGSTGTPKAVMHNHSSLIARCAATAEMNSYTSEDISLNWFSLDHVVGIIMFHFRDVYLACQQIHATPELVLQKPTRWLDWISRYRATITWAPNFAFGLINDQLEKLQNTATPSWNLSSMRFILNGGEAIVPKTARKFLQLLEPYQLPGTAMHPGWGMSETSSGVVFSDSFLLNSTTDEQKFVELGAPIPGFAMRIVDETNQLVEEGTIGQLQVKGASVTYGYYDNPQANQEAFTLDGWFSTGDLGFLRQGCLTITGRQKDVIIINGVNYYCHEIEAAVEEVAGVEISYTAACAVKEARINTDKLAIFFSTPLSEKTLLKELFKKIRGAIVKNIGVNPNYIIPLKKEAIPKTAIGKIQRAKLSQMFEAGEFDNIIQQHREKLTKSNLHQQPESVTDIELQVSQIWQEVLGIEEVGINDNFFELGGHSVLLVQTQNKLQDLFDVSVSIVDMFKYPTISTLANYLSQGQTEPASLLLGQKRARVRNSRQIVGNRDIAVIGMSCRFPGANNIDEFWKNLCDGVESISFFSDEEIIAAGIDKELVKNPNYVKAKPILSDVESFDADFFGYSTKEAELIDPQQRLLLECAWESLESAGYNPFTYDGAIGIYAGAVMSTYLLNNIYSNHYQQEVLTLSSFDGFQTTLANDKDYLTTRVSYKLNLTGPSVNVQTACSTSLVAIHMACSNLLAGESDMVLAGGVSVEVPQKIGHLYQEGMIISPDGHCRAFDASAQGTIFGSGAGLVVLKRLEDAIADEDHIYAVIKGSAVNNDGATKVSYMAPNGDGQAAVVTEAMTMADVNAETIAYVEAHGTGTPLGDPIEIAALTQAFRASTQSKNFCAIGSVKTNMGHLHIASGVVGFMKTVLSLYHKKIPPSLHFEQPNPQLDLPNTPFYVNTTLQDWHTQEYPRRAGVNSLGIGGTNAHVILEEAPIGIQNPKFKIQNENPIGHPYYLLALSAKTPKALEELRHSYREFLISNADVLIADVCYTANTGREHFNHRLAVVADSREQLLEQLADFTSQKSAQSNYKSAKIAFLFTGQGSQYINMGRQLCDRYPIFRQTLELCDEILRPYLEHSLLEVLYPNQNVEQVSLLLNQTAYTQPALFAFEYALYQLWKSWGIEPDVVMGHSVGEYVASCVAGVFSLEDGLKLIAHRGQLMQQLPSGGEMVSLMASEQRVREVIASYNQRVAIAAINNPESVVISGASADIAAICHQLEAEGIKTKRLQVSHAFHSPLMTPMLADFEAIANQVTYHQPQIPLVSNITGELADEKIANAEYWVNHIRQTVRFADSMQTLHQQGYEIFLEIGPKATLLGMGHQCLPDNGGLWLPSLRFGVSERQQLLSSLAELYIARVNVNWSEFESNYPHQKVVLPTYPFQRQRYWIENTPRRPQQQQQPKLHPLLDKKLQLPLSKEILFESEFSTHTLPFLAEHQVYNQVVVPGACHLSLLLGAAKLTFASEECLLENIVFPQPLVIPSGKARTVQLLISPREGGASFQLISFEKASNDNIQAGEWLVHSTGEISQGIKTTPETISIPQIQARCQQQIEAAEIYQNLQKRQLQLGASFQCLDAIWCGEGEALAKIKFDLGNEQQEYQLYPGLIDSCLQLTSTFLPDDTFVPFAIASFQFYQRPQSQQLWCHARRRQQQNSHPEKFLADIRLFDLEGRLIADITGLEVKKVTQQLLLHSLEQDIADWLYEIDWQAVEKSQSVNTSQGSWLILTDSQGLGAQLAEQLQEQGSDCILVSAGVSYEKIDHQHYQIDPNQGEHWQKLVSLFQQVPLNIIHLWSIAPSQTDYSNLAATELKNCGSVLHLVQALERQDWQTPPRLWLVTQGTQAMSVQLAGTSLWGLSRVIAQEHPELQCVRLDLCPQGTLQQHLQALLLELLAPDVEDQISIRHGKRYVARLVRRKDRKQLTTDSHQPVQLKLSEYGVLDHLSLEAMTRRSPQINEVEIQVKASTVNFRDVLNALGMLKEYYAEKMGIIQASELTFGFECAGNIVAVGQNVDHLQVGDEVVAWVTTHDALSSFVTLPATTVVKKPTTLSFQEAATIPLAFLTAHYGLHHLAKIQPGERVLIHAAAGGVGLAAVQIALSAGADVFATASVNKWEFLKSIGVKHLMNSRSLEFADTVMSLTQGQGVDVVLNSLNGEFIHKSLQVLAHKGRFIEIGKLGIWDESQVKAVRDDILYFAFDLGEVHYNYPDLISPMLQQLMEQLQVGNLKPLPQTVFSLEQVVDAFRYMAAAKHIGKVVVSMPQISSAVDERQLSLQPDASYLITGAFGALGLEVAEWLIEKGARYLVLTGRSQASVATKERISGFEQLGAKVLVVQGDISETQQVVELLEKIHSQFPSLRGIIHAAGVLDDGVLGQQSLERFSRVMAPKVAGAWNLHNLTLERSLDFFICFSSISSLIGSAGQGNYAAANAFMDALAHYRRAMGLRGLSINWGPWSQVGMTATLDSRNQNRIQGIGIGTIAPQLALVGLEQLLNQSSPQVAIAPINWPELITNSTVVPPFFANFTQTLAKKVAQSEFRNRLEAASPSDRQPLLIDHICSQVAKVLGKNLLPNQDLEQGFFELGMDSLTAVELRNRLQNSLGCSLSSSLTFDYPTITALADYLAKEVLLIETSAIAQPASEESDLSTDFDELSESEIEKLLAEELATIQKGKGQ